MTRKTHETRGTRRAGGAPALLRLAALAALALAASPAAAADVWLHAGTTTKSPPGAAAPIEMWGFGECTADFATCEPVRVPGPPLRVPAAEAGLTIHLRNGLAVPISIVIPGQLTTMAPVWFEPGTTPLVVYPGARPAGNLTARVRSFTHETAAGDTGLYAWPDLRPGTYLYQSGTHPQVQVQMGLYGAVVKDAVDATAPTRAQAYPGVEYDHDVTVLYSELDRVLHDAVADGSYGSAPGPTSTFDYRPRWFLVNGEPYEAGAAPLATVAGGERTLLRFVNAGLKTHVPMLLGHHMALVAEDGKPYPWQANPRLQYTLLLPAAKTADAVVTPVNAGGTNLSLALLDRSLDVTNAGAPDGGLIAFLSVTPGASSAPTITSTPETAATQGVAYTYQATATDPDPGDALAWTLDLAPAGMTISPAGLVQWTPLAGQVGPNDVTVRVTDLGGLSATQPFTITVASANHPPVAADDGPFTMVVGGTLAVAAPGVLANDSDPDGDALTAVGWATGIGALTGNADGSFSWTFPSGSAGTRTLTYQAQDGGGLSDGATVTVNVLANRAPTAVADTFSAPRRTSGNAGLFPRVLPVLANDSDPDTALDPANRIDPATVVISSAPNRGGSATVNADGTIAYTPRLNYRGTETLRYRVRDTRNALSAAAVVRINVQ